MNYVVSDLHGCYDKFMKMLDLIGLKEEDTLYVLGDVVDRGPDSVGLIVRLASQKNVVTLMGNHDYLAALMLKTFGTEERGGTSLCGKPEAEELFEAWRGDGGETTWREFVKLTEQEKRVVLRFLGRLPVFAEIGVNGQAYHLSHTIPGRDRMKDESDRGLSDFLFAAPEYGKVYYDDRILVTGHTPTGLIDPCSAGRIWKKNNHIAVDCGAVFGNPLGCICLDTGEEYYAH